MREKTAHALALVFALAFLLSGWAAGAQTGGVTDRGLGLALALSTAVQAGTVAEGFLYDEAYFPALFLGTASLQNLAWLPGGGTPALTGAAVQLGLGGLFAANSLAFGRNAFTPLLFNAAHKWSMYETYAGYRARRASSPDPAYAGAGRALDFSELSLAVFDADNYKDWRVWGYLGSMAAYAAISMLGRDGANAVWTTGKAYIGERAFPLWAGLPLMLALQLPNFIMTGVGEEALYRGVYYEELSLRTGLWPAKLVDAAWFTASHLPQQWEEVRTMDAARFVLKTALSMGQAFWFQHVYEARGLKAAVVAHAMSDVIIFFGDWLLQAGVPNEGGFSINDRGGLSIGFRL
jgi:membrane protease YdiL (CAAX protease family)